VPLEVAKTKVRRGDVLFARRNTHLRRCAVAPFDTYFSPDGYALRSSSPNLLQEFLLFVVASKAFMDYAVAHSAGTHSKRVKWSELAAYYFTLPPIETQRQTIELLEAANAAVITMDQSVRACSVAIDSVAAQAVDDPFSLVDVASGSSPKRVSLREIATLRRGRFSHRPRNEPRLYSTRSEFPFVQTGDIQQADRFLTKHSQFLSEEGTTFSRSVPAGTLLTTIAAVIGATAYTTQTTYLPDSVVSIEPKADSCVGYLELLIRGMRQRLENVVATENTQKNLSLELLGAVEVPLVPLRVQQQLADVIDELWGLHRSVAQTHRNLVSVRSSLLERCLSGAPDVQ
jgi:type I restriction enzyme S subunit